MITATMTAASTTGAPRTSALSAELAGRRCCLLPALPSPWPVPASSGTALRLLRRVVLTKAGQRGREFRPREDRRIRVARARQAGGVEDDPHAPVAQPGHAGLEHRMARERHVRPGSGHDRQAEPDRLVQQPEREGVADAGPPLVDRVEGSWSDRAPVGRRHPVRLARLLVLYPHAV